MCRPGPNLGRPPRGRTRFLGRPEGCQTWGDTAPRVTLPGWRVDPLGHLVGRAQGEWWADLPSIPSRRVDPSGSTQAGGDRRGSNGGLTQWASPPWTNILGQPGSNTVGRPPWVDPVDIWVRALELFDHFCQRGVLIQRDFCQGGVLIQHFCQGGVLIQRES